MKNISFLLLLLTASFNTYADTGEIDEKKFTIGIGSYVSVVAYDDEQIQNNDEFAGLSLSFGYAFNDHIGLRGSYFSLEHDDFSDLDSKGYDLLVYGGKGLSKRGFKFYGGAGLFNDKWERGSFSQSFNGLQLSGGVGYNWDVVALEFIFSIRDSSDYEDFVNKNSAINVTAGAGSGQLLVSYRF